MMKKQKSSSLNRRSFILTGVGALAASTLPTFGQKQFSIKTDKNRSRPNILFLHTDQQHSDYFSALGHPYVKTPHMDQIINEGYRFRNAYASNPVCGPCRSSWFTGRHSSETGCVDNRIPISKTEKFPDMGQWLGNAGYETLHCGKWHFNGRDQHTSFDYIPSFTHWGEHADLSCAKVMAGYFASRRNDKPFFASVGLVNPHDIGNFRSSILRQPDHTIDPNLIEHFPELPSNFNIIPEDEPTHIHHFQRKGKLSGWSDLKWRYYIWAYHRYTEMVDESVGFIMQALKASKYHENTYVIFTSDHGDGAGHHKTYGKPLFYEQAARIPFVVHHPTEVSAGEHSESLVSTLDIFPTACDYAGIAPPQRMQGNSIRPMVEKKKAKVRDHLYAEANLVGRMIRSDRYKFIQYHGDPKVQLFDMKSDPMETKNIAVNNQNESVVAEHRELLAQSEDRLYPAPTK